MRAQLLLIGLLGASFAIASSTAAQERTSLMLRVGDDARDLYAEVSLQMAEWDVVLGAAPEGTSFLQRAATAQLDLQEHAGVAWLEQDGNETRLVLLTPQDETPRTSPLPVRSTPDWERVVALVLDGLVASEPSSARFVMPEENVGLDPPTPTAETAPPPPQYAPIPRRPSRWPSPLARNGWMFRFGWFFSMSPREADGFGAYTDDGDVWSHITAGLRFRLGRYLTRVLRVDLTAHLGKTEADIGPEGGFDVQLVATSATRFRMGAGIGFGMLIVGERDEAAGGNFGWVGYWASIPMEMGFDFNRRSGMHLQIGPTFTKPPYSPHVHPGFIMSLEAEFDFGSHG